MINIVNKWNDIKIWLLVLKVRFIKFEYFLIGFFYVIENLYDM